MTSILAREQSTLLQALARHASSDVNTPFNSRGLQVYQANRAVQAERTLASTFPVICQLTGLETFDPMARHYWQQHPPHRGEMGQWGEHLPEFLAAADQLAGEPFLADVARIEWALHRAASARDPVLDTASFALLCGQADNARPVCLALSPGTVTLASAYPVASIVNAHLAGEPTLDEAAALLSQGQGEHALVWRQGFKAKVRRISAAEYGLINALAKGLALDAALDQVVSSDPDFDFNAWLAQAVQTGLVTGAIYVTDLQH